MLIYVLFGYNVVVIMIVPISWHAKTGWFFQLAYDVRVMFKGPP